jgi:hypothetical protein
MHWPGRCCRDPASTTEFINISGMQSGLTQAARSPGQAAASAAHPASAASTASAASATPAAATTAATGFLNHAPQRSGVLLVEDIEGCQADVGNFLFTKCDLLTRREVGRPWLILQRRDRGGCTSHERKSQSGGAKRRYGFSHTLSFRSLLHSWHSRYLHLVHKNADLRFASLRFADVRRKLVRDVGNLWSHRLNSC